MPGGPAHIYVVLTLLERFALVLEGLALAKGKLDFDHPLFQIKLERDKRKPLLLDLRREPENLLLAHQELSMADRVMVESVAASIGRDVHVDKRKLAVVDSRIGLIERNRLHAAALNFSALKRYARFEGLYDLIVMESLAVASYDIVLGIFSRHWNIFRSSRTI